MRNRLANSPKKRFDFFNDEYRQVVLEELVSFHRGSSISLSSFSDDGKFPAIAYGHLYTEYNEIIKKVDKLSNEEGFLSKKGDILFPGSSTVPKGTAQAGALLVDNVHLGGDIIIARPVSKVDSRYLSYMINAQKYKMFPITVGTTITHMYAKDLSKIDYNLPSYEEQKTVSDFFGMIDKMIKLQALKLDKIRQTKYAFLYNMLLKRNVSFPNIRFNGFNSDWEEYRLGDLGSVSMNKRIFKSQTSENGEIPFYKIGTFGGKADAFITKSLFEEYKQKYAYPEIGDILISASGTIGRTVQYNGEKAYYQDSNIVWLNHKGKINNNFLKQFYKIVDWYGLEGSTIKRLYNNNILKTKIMLPSIEEQKAIGNFFETLDRLIELNEQKLNKLEDLKKAFLNEMFV